MDNPFESGLEQLRQAAKIANLDVNAVERLKNHDRIVEVSIPIIMDSGEQKIFKGFRAQHNNSRGPYKGGIRYQQHVGLDEVKALSFWMSFKNAIVNIPLGGGKGGVTVNVKELSSNEIERLSRGFVQKMYLVLGPEVDVPGPDVNTNAVIMSTMADEYGKITHHPKSLASFTGKILGQGGSEGREEATGYGGFYVFEEVVNSKVLDLPKGATIAIQGFGNVATFFAQKAVEAGYKVVAVSDSKGGIYMAGGLDLEKVMEYKKSSGSLKDFPGAENINNEQLLELNVDVLVPAALENSLTKENAEKIKARLIFEMANGPTTPDADEVFAKKSMVVIPDILANSGGVCTSYFEWYQNMHAENWTKEQVLEKLSKQIKQAFVDVLERQKKYNTTFRNAAYVLGAERITEAMGKGSL
ncbi:MAG TPA: Glu/Leu/Phe/Val dehydrogenase [Candidatus Limnocylindria bacterium]|nr:Glu/Leu/Phe/Val dehydrogenase [Candidatus Limnocylindria bacterium]